MNILDLGRKRTSTLLVTASVFFCFLAGGQLEAAKIPKTEICHFDAEEGVFKKISVSGNAVPNHMDNHGDIFPSGENGDGSIQLDADCNEPMEPRVMLARAYIDVDRNGRYEADKDVEIAELVDSPGGDGVPGAFDSLLLGQYPKSPDPCPLGTLQSCNDLGNFASNELVVDAAGFTIPAHQLTIEIGSHTLHFVEFEGEVEIFGDNQFEPSEFQLADRIGEQPDGGDARDSILSIASAPPLAPSAEVTVLEVDTTDGYFINVEFNFGL